MHCTINGLYVERIGQGTPMLCMHGGMGFDASTLRPWLEPLSDTYELICYDHRGNGRSAAPDDWCAMSHERWVADAEELRAELDLQEFILFGHSWGGFLAQEYALKYPQHLKGLILCSTAPALDFGERIVANAQARGTQHQVAALLSVLQAPIASDEALRDFMLDIGSLYFHRPTEAVVQQVFGPIRYCAAAFNTGLFQCAPHFDTTPALSSLQAPTLVMGGSDDWIMPPDVGALRLANLIPQSQLQVFEDIGHFPFVEAAPAFLSAVRGFAV